MSLIYANFLYRMEEMIYKQYEISSTIKHKGEKGRQREEGLAQFLRENLPEKYGVGTGEIISSEGDKVSPQCDIIIYDRLNMPIIGKTNSVQQIPIEAVFAVIEVKSNLDKESLKDAEKKLSTIRNLPRCPSITELQAGKMRGPIFILFGYTLKTDKEACVSFVRANEIKENVSVFALDTGGTIYIKNQEGADFSPVFLTTSAERPGKKGVHFTLGLFFLDILESLDKVDLGQVDFKDLLKPLHYNVDEIISLKLNK